MLPWNLLKAEIKVAILAGASTVSEGLLLENETLVAMIRRGDSKADCLNFINENF